MINLLVQTGLSHYFCCPNPNPNQTDKNFGSTFWSWINVKGKQISFTSKTTWFFCKFSTISSAPWKQTWHLWQQNVTGAEIGRVSRAETSKNRDDGLTACLKKCVPLIKYRHKNQKLQASLYRWYSLEAIVEFVVAERELTMNFHIAFTMGILHHQYFSSSQKISANLLWAGAVNNALKYCNHWTPPALFGATLSKLA